MFKRKDHKSKKQYSQGPLAMFRFQISFAVVGQKLFKAVLSSFKTLLKKRPNRRQVSFFCLRISLIIAGTSTYFLSSLGW